MRAQHGPCPLRGFTEDGTGVWVQILPGSGSPGSKLSTLSTPGGGRLGGGPCSSNGGGGVGGGHSETSRGGVPALGAAPCGRREHSTRPRRPAARGRSATREGGREGGGGGPGGGGGGPGEAGGRPGGRGEAEGGA